MPLKMDYNLKNKKQKKSVFLFFQDYFKNILLILNYQKKGGIISKINNVINKNMI